MISKGHSNSDVLWCSVFVLFFEIAPLPRSFLLNKFTGSASNTCTVICLTPCMWPHSVQRPNWMKQAGMSHRGLQRWDIFPVQLILAGFASSAPPDCTAEPSNDASTRGLSAQAAVRHFALCCMLNVWGSVPESMLLWLQTPSFSLLNKRLWVQKNQ